MISVLNFELLKASDLTGSGLIWPVWPEVQNKWELFNEKNVLSIEFLKITLGRPGGREMEGGEGRRRDFDGTIYERALKIMYDFSPRIKISI